MADLLEQLQSVFCDVFNDETIVLSDSTTAHDIEGWDSLMHINLIIAVEKRFGIRFATAEIASLKSETQNVGTFKDLVASKLGPSKTG